jgi:deoxyribodipyrimidine photo-lyase
VRSIVWFRHNLRLSDNRPLFLAAKEGPVLPVYVQDPSLSLFPDTGRRRWRQRSLVALDRSLRPWGNRLHVFSGSTHEILGRVAAQVRAETVYAFRGVTCEERREEELLERRLRETGTALQLTGFDTLFPPDRAAEGRPSPWKVFTPYYRFCRQTFLPELLLPAPSRLDPLPFLSPLPGEERVPGVGEGKEMSERLEGFDPGEAGAGVRLREFLGGALAGYASRRDFPAESSTSRLSPHLAAGEVSVREIVQRVQESDAPREDREKFLEELGWREFSAHLLFSHPEMLVEPLKKEYAGLEWMSEEAGFLAWTQGRTGLPFVDAGMRELAETGWMHNRVRMVAASFLVKNLGIAWQSGARWFAEKLLDYDPANNATSWQWVAGCGTDAAPFFRIMNPLLQGQRYDPHGRYVRRFIPELAALPDGRIHAPWKGSSSGDAGSSESLNGYPEPLVDLSESREAALRRYRRIKELSS